MAHMYAEKNKARTGQYFETVGRETGIVDIYRSTENCEKLGREGMGKKKSCRAQKVVSCLLDHCMLLLLLDFVSP